MSLNMCNQNYFFVNDSEIHYFMHIFFCPVFWKEWTENNFLPATEDYYQSNPATNYLVKNGQNDKNMKLAG